jgi:hypothetical protein
MNTVELNLGEWDLVVDLEGGRINSLKNKGILILGSFERIDGKRGNTHVCIPNFADNGVKEYGLPSHGPFRDAPWVLVQKSENVLEINCENWELDVHQVFSFSGEYFSQKVIIENKSGEEKPVNAALHNYWSSELGWQGLTLNGFDLSLGVKRSDFINLGQLNNLDIPGKPLIKWQLVGFKYARLWTGFLEESGNKIFDNSYVCIEPVIEKDENFFGSEKSMLLPKMKMELKQMIGVVCRSLA